VILDRSADFRERFLARHATRPLRDDEKVTALKLLELQRQLLLMYTSCGWFFDDISGLETVQVIQFAGRAVQLAQELFGDGAGVWTRMQGAYDTWHAERTEDVSRIPTIKAKAA
jgi:hypothetical protein